MENTIFKFIFVLGIMVLAYVFIIEQREKTKIVANSYQRIHNLSQQIIIQIQTYKIPDAKVLEVLAQEIQKEADIRKVKGKYDF